MVTRKKAHPSPAPVEEVVAEEYTEDTDWDGVPEGQESIEVEGAEPKKRGRQVSPLIVATREYEKTHKAAEKARDALAKVQPLADAAEAAEKEEAAAWAALQAILADLR